MELIYSSFIARLASFSMALLGFFWVAPPSSAETLQESFTLQDIYNLARERAPTLSIAGYQVDGAIAQRDVARGRILPQVSIFGDWSENKVQFEGSELSQIPDQDYPGERYGLQLRTTIFNMRSFRDIERTEALVTQSEQQLAVSERELLRAVVESYLDVLLADESSTQLESELAAVNQQLAEATALYEKSLLPVTAVLETQTRADTLQADLIMARGRAQIAQEKLIQIVGIRDLPLRPVRDKISLLSQVAGAEEATQLALQFDPAIKAASEGVKAAKKAVDRERGSWFPEIDFVYNSQYSDVGFDNLTSPPRDTQSYSVSLRYPLFQGGAGAARIRGAWADFYVAQQELELTTREVVANARASWVQLEAANERVQAARQAVKTSEVNLTATKASVRAGTARFADTLVAISQNSRAKRNLSQAKFERVIGWLNVEFATGAATQALVTDLSNALH